MAYGADFFVHSLVRRGEDRGDFGISQASCEVNNLVFFRDVVSYRIIYDGDGNVKKRVDRVILSVPVAVIIPICILHERVVESNADILLAELRWIATIVIREDFLDDGVVQLSKNLLL